MPEFATQPLTMTVRGVEVPRVGLGTWEVTGRDCYDAVRDALDIGYRHVDTAAAYGNEQEVGRAIADSSVERGDLWLTSKVWMEDTEPDRLRASAERSLRRLGTDFLDLLLIHWPGDPEHFSSSLETLAALREEGLIRELGVSNYPPGHLRRALEVAPVFANQVEMHPYFGQADLLHLADEHDLLIQAYAPIGTGRVLQDETLNEIAGAHGKGPAQVALRWLLLRERVCVLPRSTDHGHRVENLDLSFELTEEERRRIDALSEPGERFFDPSFAPDWSD